MSFKPTFVAELPVSTSSADPAQARRKALIDRLKDQKALALDPSYQRSYKIRTKDESGKVVYESGKANIRQSWRDNVFYVRVGKVMIVDELFAFKAQLGHIALKRKLSSGGSIESEHDRACNFILRDQACFQSEPRRIGTSATMNARD